VVTVPTIDPLPISTCCEDAGAQIDSALENTRAGIVARNIVDGYTSFT
jgi:hypothetical protein